MASVDSVLDGVALGGGGGLLTVVLVLKKSSSSSSPLSNKDILLVGFNLGAAASATGFDGGSSVLVAAGFCCSGCFGGGAGVGVVFG